MKSFTYAALLTAFGFAGCASQKQFEENPPFVVSDPTVQMMAAGREESGGVMTEVSFRWTPAERMGIEIDSLYFRGRVLKPILTDTETGMVLSARYPSVSLEKPDLTMHADSLREVGNQPPAPLPGRHPFPFELKRDEAVLSYRIKAEPGRWFYRITGIVEKPGRALPARPH
jgi:hypothetical protein